jgi:chromosome segregation ATPase
MKLSNWTKMLEQLQESLNSTAAEVDRQEQALTSPLLTGEPPAGLYANWQAALDRVGKRLQECQARVQLAGQQAESAEATLREQEEQIDQLRQRVADIQQKLTHVPAITIE